MQLFYLPHSIISFPLLIDYYDKQEQGIIMKWISKCYFTVQPTDKFISFFFSGTINGQKWKTSKCSWNTKTSFLTKYQNTALNHGIYKNSCSCKAGYFLNEMKLNFNFTDKLWNMSMSSFLQIIECSFSGIPCSQETKGACVIRSGSDVKCWYQKNSCSLTTIGCGWSSPVCPRPWTLWIPTLIAEGSMEKCVCNLNCLFWKCL